MKNVLVFAYYFPPLGLSGVQRTLAFAKYLPQFGWKPTVITVGDIAYYAHDNELLNEVEKNGIDVIRTKSLDPHSIAGKGKTFSMPSESKRKILSILSDTFLFPDSKRGWKKFAQQAARNVLKTKKIDAVFSTAPPYTAHIAASEIAKEYNKPLFLDYRDAWVDYPFRRYITPFHKLMHEKKEKQVIANAHKVIVASDSIYNVMEQRYRTDFSTKAQIISQGYDPEYFNESVPEKKNDKIIITYSGIFYEDRTPEYLMRAVKKLLERKPELRNKVELWFIGVFREEHKTIINETGLQDIVRLWGYVNHIRCVELLHESDILWAMMMDDCSTPGKIFEYIGARKHILGCVPTNGAMAKIIRECDGTVIAPDNSMEIEHTLETLIEKSTQGTLAIASNTVREKYDRRNLTKILAETLDTSLSF